MSLLINQAFFLHENPYTETQKNEKNKKIPLKNHSSPQVSWVSYRRKVSVKDLLFYWFEKTIFILPLGSTVCTLPVEDVAQC